MDKRIIGAAIAAIVVIAAVAVAFAMRPSGQGDVGGRPAVDVSAQPTSADAPSSASTPSSSSSASAAVEEEEPAHEASAVLVGYADALGEGNTVLDAGSDDDVDAGSDVHGRALSVLAEGIGEFRALPYHSQASDDVDAVITNYFYSYPNIAYYVYDYTCEGKGALDEGSLALFKSGDLSPDMYKAAFTIVDGAGAPAAYVDGYYDDSMAMYKISDISMAGKQG